MSKWYRNELIGYAEAFVSSISFILPIWFFFYTQHLGYSIELSIFLSALEMWVMMLLEVPTWTLADRFWRKRMFIIGSSLVALSLLPFIFSTSLLLIVIWIVVSWVGYSLLSWTFDPMVYDQCENNNDKKAFRRYRRNRTILSFGARALSAVVWAYLFDVDPIYPYIWVCILSFVSVLLWLWIEEVEYTKEKTRVKFTDFFSDWWNYLTSDWSINRLLIIFLWSYIAWNMMWSLYQYFFDEIWFSITVVWRIFAWCSIVSMISSVLTKYYYTWSSSFDRIVYILFWSIVGWVVLIWYTNWRWILSWVVLIQFYFWMYNPILMDAIQEAIPSSHRSTSLSIYSLIESLVTSVATSLSWVLVVYLWRADLSMVLLWVVWIVALIIIRMGRKDRHIVPVVE